MVVAKRTCTFPNEVRKIQELFVHESSCTTSKTQQELNIFSLPLRKRLVRQETEDINLDRMQWSST